MMFWYLKTIGCGLILLALSVAGFSDAQASPIIIDDFNEVTQKAPTASCGRPPLAPCVASVPSAIGGFRTLEQVAGGNTIVVLADDAQQSGVLFVNHGAFTSGGTTRITWDADGAGLGGVDLTLGGDRFQLSSLLLEAETTFLESMTLNVTDTGVGQSKFTVTYQDICVAASAECTRSTYDILFSSLNAVGGGAPADLTSVDSISLSFFTSPGSNGDPDFVLGSFRVVSVPEPSTALLLGLSLTGLGVVGRSRRRATE